jgi:retron-type reverse transcriptase
LVPVSLATFAGGGRIKSMHNFSVTYNDIISVENLLDAWKCFRVGKKNKTDVMEFEYKLMENILSLHTDLKNKTYSHGNYYAFKINDPKPRDIHKASVRDRVLHHAIYRVLYPLYDKTFISDSYSCRVDKGTHKAIKRFKTFTRGVSKNYTTQCWVLKCDIRKFFASVDHEILFEILEKKIRDRDILGLLKNIVQSFSSGTDGKGLPLGNLTSQLLVNIYMKQFDQYVKHKLKHRYYIRYADDFVFISNDKKVLETIKQKCEAFLLQVLKLSMHPDKVFIKTIYSGVDFLGWVHFVQYRVLRTSTKRRMLRSVNEENVESYRGMLGWGDAKKLESAIAGCKKV